MRFSRVAIAHALLERTTAAVRVRFATALLRAVLDAPSFAAVRWALDATTDAQGARVSPPISRPDPKP